MSDIFLQSKHAKYMKLHLHVNLQTLDVLYQVEDPLQHENSLNQFKT